jgi:hypothetical protein
VRQSNGALFLSQLKAEFKKGLGEEFEVLPTGLTSKVRMHVASAAELELWIDYGFSIRSIRLGRFSGIRGRGNSETRSVRVSLRPNQGAVAFDCHAARTSLVVMSIVPAAEGSAAGAKRILRCSLVILCRVAPPRITKSIVGLNTRVCGCHTHYDDPARRIFEKIARRVVGHVARVVHRNPDPTG